MSDPITAFLFFLSLMGRGTSEAAPRPAYAPPPPPPPMPPEPMPPFPHEDVVAPPLYVDVPSVPVMPSPAVAPPPVMPPWPSPVQPAGLPPFPGPGWVYDNDANGTPPAATQARAQYWSPILWNYATKTIVKPFVTEQTGGRWLTFAAAWHPGSKGPQTYMAVEAYRLASEQGAAATSAMPVATPPPPFVSPPLAPTVATVTAPAAPPMVVQPAPDAPPMVVPAVYVQPHPDVPAGPVPVPSAVVSAAHAALSALAADANYRVDVSKAGSAVNTAVHNFKAAYNAAYPNNKVPIGTGLYETSCALALSQSLGGVTVPAGYNAPSPGTPAGNAYPPAAAPPLPPPPTTMMPRDIQHGLNRIAMATGVPAWPYPLTEDGNLGAVLSAGDVQKALSGTLSKTAHLSRQAIVAFQKQNGLRVDSDPGPQTQAMILAQLGAMGSAAA